MLGLLSKLRQGKLNIEALKRVVSAARETLKDYVLIGPEIGYDSAVFKIKDELIAITNDPAIMIPKSIPIEMFAFGTVHFAASDLVVFGARPEIMIYTIIFPVGYEEEKALRIIEEIKNEAKKLNISIVGGHTAAYSGIMTPVSSTTMLGKVIRLLSPKNIKAGDVIISTDKIALEFIVALAYENLEKLEEILGERAKRYLDLWREETVVSEALALLDIEGVHAMHDVTEGGLIGSLYEWSYATGLGIIVNLEKIPLRDEIRTVLSYLNINPMNVSSTGTLLIACEREYSEEIIRKLRMHKLDANVIGEFIKGRGVKVFKEGKEIKVEMKDVFAEVFRA